MSIKVEIKNTELTFKSGNAKNTGKPYEFAEQEGWAHLPGEPYPVKVRFTLPDEARGADGRWNPWAPGTYEIDLGRSLNVGRFDSLQLSSRLYLKSSGTARAAAA